MDDQDNARTPSEEIPQLIDHLRAAMLRKMVLMMTEIPAGYYTEIKGEITGPGLGTWKMRDFAATLKDLAAIGKTGSGGTSSGPDVESWEPLREIFGDANPHSWFDAGDDDDEETEQI